MTIYNIAYDLDVLSFISYQLQQHQLTDGQTLHHVSVFQSFLTVAIRYNKAGSQLRNTGF